MKNFVAGSMPPKYLHALVLRIMGQLHDKIREEANSAEDYSATKPLWMGQGRQHGHCPTLRETSNYDVLRCNSFIDQLVDGSMDSSTR
mmetsp:Transcript_40973/g.64609  ORF Transcript_40973/g.64609 Transcript_40973/m.64609 type:complete len:88 (-) Transcript_40973:441-704(-)